ncbi:MAG: hypothetical protein AAF514_09120, partial [Verrucomicrobiota bacterium]
MSTSIIIFLLGLMLLGLFLWYFGTDSPRRKRIIGLVLTILLTAICLQQLWPRQSNKTDERMKFENLTATEVDDLKTDLEAVLTEKSFTSDEADMRDTFPGKAPETYDE